MDSYIIQVQPREELAAIVDKIMKTEAQRIYLLISENSPIAQHALNFRLLKREAESLEKEIIIVSSSPQVQNLALRSSLQAHAETHEFQEAVERNMQDDFLIPSRMLDVLPAVPSTVQSLEIPRGAEPVKQFPKREIKNRIDAAAPSAIDTFWTKQSAKRTVFLKEASKNFFQKTAFLSAFISSKQSLRRILFMLMGIAAIIGAVTFYSILPRARIHIVPVSEEVRLEIQLTADTNILAADPSKFVIPGQIFEKSIEEVKQVSATGEREVKQRATGRIKVYNAYSSSPQTLVGATRFISEDGKLFRTVDTVIVPGAEVQDGKIIPRVTTVKVAAAESGEEYNIGPSSFSIPGFKGTPKYLGFYGKSEERMEGGRAGIVKTISENDYNNASDALLKELEARKGRELGLLLPQGVFTPEGAEYASEKKISSPNRIGDVAADFVLTGTLSMKVFALHEQEIFQMFEGDFSERFPGKRLSPRKEKVDYEVIKLDFKKGALTFKASVHRKAHLIINKEEIVAGVRGKKEDDVRSFLSGLKNIKEARATFWPFWVTSMPNDSNRIEVTIEEEA